MATRVKYVIPELEIENTGITFKRTLDKGFHGDLTIRQNYIDWRPVNNEMVYRVPRDKFAEFAQTKGRRVRPKATVVKSRKKLKPTRA